MNIQEPRIIIPKDINQDELESYFHSQGLGFLVKTANEGYVPSINEVAIDEPYRPELLDLYRLHSFIILNKRLTVLEFGSGWSSLVMADALKKNRHKYIDNIENLRKANLFELHAVDNEEHYLNISEERLNKEGFSNYSFLYSKVFMTEYNGKICTRYKELPFVNPDFIYLDGPDQFNHIEGTISGLSTAHNDFMPMPMDLILIEHFLTPGTIIIADGRTANVRFLLSNFQRNWNHQHDYEVDQHILFLDEEPLGVYNNNQLEFYNSNDTYQVHKI
ncbi:MAG: hypothetical protein HN733_01365 [Gammaproteobacteria bacterium]|nr:hypothetical protein [Gammaproteobacteria bacterium]